MGNSAHFLVGRPEMGVSGCVPDERAALQIGRNGIPFMQAHISASRADDLRDAHFSGAVMRPGNAGIRPS